MRELFARDPQRFAQMSREACGLFVDYSKHRITDETMALLLRARAAGRRRGLARQDVRRREDQRHRGPRRPPRRAAQPLEPADPRRRRGRDARGQRACSRRCATSPSASARGAWKGHTGKTITDIVNIGIGGSDLGPVMVTEALRPYWQARPARALRLERRRHAHRRDAARGSTPSARSSSSRRKTFTTQETLTNARSARAWLLEQARRRPERGREALRRALDQREGGRGVRHRHREHVRVLGLGRRPLLALVRDRPARSRCVDRHGPLRGAARRRARRWTSTSAPRRSRRTCRSILGDARRLVRQLLRRRDPRDPALRPVPAPLRRLLPAGRHGVATARASTATGHADRRLHDRPGHLGRARHQRPARVLPAHPPGHAPRSRATSSRRSRRTTRSASTTRSCSPTSSRRPRR